MGSAPVFRDILSATISVSSRPVSLQPPPLQLLLILEAELLVVQQLPHRRAVLVEQINTLLTEDVNATPTLFSIKGSATHVLTIHL